MKFINPPHYTIWRGMLHRCYNPKSKAHKNYGGRGITVCEHWHNYINFIADIGDRPDGTSADRIDNNKGYSPDNFRWATRTQQQRNQRRTRKVIIDGIEYIAAELADLSNKKTDTIIKRAEAGLSYEEVIDKKKHPFTKGLSMGGPANGKRKLAQTHCQKGHPFNEKNTRITPEGWRACKQCHADKMRRRTANKLSKKRN